MSWRATFGPRTLSLTCVVGLEESSNSHKKGLIFSWPMTSKRQPKCLVKSNLFSNFNEPLCLLQIHSHRRTIVSTFPACAVFVHAINSPPELIYDTRDFMITGCNICGSKDGAWRLQHLLRKCVCEHFLALSIQWVSVNTSATQHIQFSKV